MLPVLVVCTRPVPFSTGTISTFSTGTVSTCSTGTVSTFSTGTDSNTSSDAVSTTSTDSFSILLALLTYIVKHHRMAMSRSHSNSILSKLPPVICRYMI